MKVLNMMTSEDIKRITSQTDLPLLIEHYKNEIWKWKQKESKWLSDKNLLEGSKKTIDELATKLIEISEENKKLKEKVLSAEGETSLVKAIGINSPEMIAVKKEVCELRQDNRRLSKQVEDGVDRMRKAGVI